jgi:DNA-binding NarL/FixJ family response regulator
MTEKIRIVIADDNRFFTAALKDSMKQHSEFEILTTFNTLEGLISYTSKIGFDILLLDVNFNGVSSLDVMDQIRPTHSTFKIVLLTTWNSGIIKQKAKELRIECIVGKDEDYSQFKSKIIDCYKTSYSFANQKKSKITIDNQVFTKRNIEVLRAICKHAECKESEIAARLHISQHTLKSHKKELFVKTNTKNTPDLIKFGFRNGFILI